MYKHFIVLLGIFLSSLAPAAAQAPIPRIVLAQEGIAPTMTMLRTKTTPLLSASFLYQKPGNALVHFDHLYTPAHERQESLGDIPRIVEVKTLFFTQSSLPLVQLWSGRLELDAFQNTLHIQNLQLYLEGPRLVRLSGLSLSFHLGQDARTEGPTEVRRCLSRIVGTILN
jgi:hypothetical protein